MVLTEYPGACKIDPDWDCEYSRVEGNCGTHLDLAKFYLTAENDSILFLALPHVGVYFYFPLDERIVDSLGLLHSLLTEHQLRRRILLDPHQ